MVDSLLLWSCIAAVIALKASLSQGNILWASFSTSCQTLLVTGSCTSFKSCRAKSLVINCWKIPDNPSQSPDLLWTAEKIHPNETNNRLDVLFLWFAAIMTSPTLKARQCELMAPVPPSQSALSRPQLNRLQFKTNICLWALSLFFRIIFRSFQVVRTSWCQCAWVKI